MLRLSPRTPSVQSQRQRILHSLAALLLSLSALNATEIVQWGDSSRGGITPGPTNPPVGLTNAVSIVGGVAHSLALTDTGRVVAWGNNTFGQTNVPNGLTNVVAVAAGTYHNLALTDDGRVTGWGYNNAGQTNVPLGLSNVVQVSAGEEHSLALRSDGSIVAWGEFANGITNDPAAIPAGLSNCITIGTGAWHALGITADGRVIVWGDRFKTNTPASLSNAVAITGGRDVSIALTANGRVKVWGATEGVSGTITNFEHEVTNGIAISMERLWAAVLLSDGRILARGYTNIDYGQTKVPSGLSNVVMIAAGGYHGLALIDSDSPETSWSLPKPKFITNSLTLDIPTRRGRLYVLEYTPSLNPGSWAVQQRFAGNGATRRISLPTGTQGFYRARRVP